LPITAAIGEFSPGIDVQHELGLGVTDQSILTMPAQTGEKLAEYRRKRDFHKTLEPAGADEAAEQGCLYVMHKHAASHDHFDLRLQQGDVLKSWALPKGASLEPGEKRLAVEVEDHPLEYGGFEGIIPKGQYGGGTVMLWDAGSWSVAGKHDADHIDLELHGKKLEGRWTLVRTKGRGTGNQENRNWLMIKRSDEPTRKLQPDDQSVASGRTMDEIAADTSRVWMSKEAATERPPLPDASAITRAQAADLPVTMGPQLTTLVDKAPTGADWLHEIKFDGYRIMARLERGEVRLYTRNGKDWTARFPEIARRLSTLPVESAMIDGEVTVLDDQGATSFRKLQEALSAGDTEHLRYYCFDLPYLDGHDLTAAPLIERKQALVGVLEAAGVSKQDPVRYSEHIEGKGQAFYEQACELGLEGIVSKRADAPYRSRRERTWLKIKCSHQQEFVVGGFTRPGGSRTGFRSLLLGAFDGPDLRYEGRVGTGFSAQQLEDLHRQLKAMTVAEKPFADAVPDTKGVTWVEPRLVIEVEYTERTRDGRLRHPVFRGVRDDREPREVTVNQAQPQPLGSTAKSENAPGQVMIAGVRISHPDRILYPEQGVTKVDLARYYEDIADWVVPLIERRPLSLLRCPEGAESECFFQKHPSPSLTKGLPRVAIAEKDATRDYVYVESLAHLVTLVQAGTLELHPWGCHVEDIEHPDLMVFDLDPGPDVAWQRMIDTTRDLRDRLADLGLTSFLRTTGGKGLHVVVPLQPRADWDELKAFARAVAERHVADDPERLTSNMSKAKRQGRIFVDYLRNGRGATAIASYSARARPGAPVAVPVRWDELDASLRPDRYNVHNLQRRLRALKSDPWADFEAARTPLTTKMRELVGRSGEESR
jgi:bifunctional non-homologous end joining protein LigD